MDFGLSSALLSLVGIPCQRSLATNSIKLSFDFREREKGRAYIWIDPPWRLTEHGIYVTSSADWPVWDGKEEPEINRVLWECWCSLFDPINSTTLAEVIVGAPLPDLRLRFNSGHEIEVFGNRIEDYWWYFRDRVTGEIFEAGSSGITRELAQPAEN